MAYLIGPFLLLDFLAPYSYFLGVLYGECGLAS